MSETSATTLNILLQDNNTVEHRATLWWMFYIATTFVTCSRMLLEQLGSSVLCFVIVHFTCAYKKISDFQRQTNLSVRSKSCGCGLCQTWWRSVKNCGRYRAKRTHNPTLRNVINSWHFKSKISTLGVVSVPIKISVSRPTAKLKI